MSYLVAAPEFLASAASVLADIGSAVTAAHAAAAPPTTEVLAAAEDEVSAAVASLFSSHGQAFQQLSAQASAFHTQFAQTLTRAGNSYAATEAANAAPGLSRAAYLEWLRAQALAAAVQRQSDVTAIPRETDELSAFLIRDEEAANLALFRQAQHDYLVIELDAEALLSFK